MARAGYVGTKPNLQSKDRPSPSIDSYTGPTLPIPVHNDGSEPRPSKLWPLTMANHTPPSPVLKRVKESVNGGVQLDNDLGVPDHTILPQD